MLRIGICDDIDVHRAILGQFVSDYFNEKKIPFEVFSFNSGEKLLHYYENNSLELIFLDIIMGNADGMTVSKQIRQSDTRVTIIFCTTHADFALESYDVYAYGYMLKPFNMD